jgi:TatA/E family protein of Tat protein translocase
MVCVLALIDGLGGTEVLFIGVLALVLFGSKRMPELGRALGRAMREFKRATAGVEENLREVLREEPVRPVLRPPAWQGPSRESATPAPALESATMSAPGTEAVAPPDASAAGSADPAPVTPPPAEAPPGSELPYRIEDESSRG